MRSVLSVMAALVAWSAQAQPQSDVKMDEPVASMDVFRGVISYVGETYNMTAICFGPGSNLAVVRPLVEAELKRMGVAGLPTPRQVIAAMVSRFPCPFSPERPELRPAASEDVQGTWVFPQASGRLIYPPRSRAWEQERAIPLACEVVGYYAEGETRTAELRGQGLACPMRSEADFAVARKNPRVATWSMPAPGRIVIVRSDVPGHVEEWETYAVQAAFNLGPIEFKPGDLVSYMRKVPGNTQNIASRFRHLQRLP